MKPNVITRVFPASPLHKDHGSLPAGGGSLSAERLHDSVAVAQPDATRYYLLSAAPGQPAADAGPTLKRWVVGVRAVAIAPYLETKSFAVRSQANEVIFLDSTRWGEPLDQGIARVLAENLQSLKNVMRCRPSPFEPTSNGITKSCFAWPHARVPQMAKCGSPPGGEFLPRPPVPGPWPRGIIPLPASAGTDMITASWRGLSERLAANRDSRTACPEPANWP